MSAWLRLGRAFDRLGAFLVNGSAFMLLAMVALLGVEIVARALFRTSTQIADEYSGYLFTWMTLCCLLYAQRSDRLIRVDSLRSRLAPRVRAAVDSVASLLAATLMAVLLYATWEMFRASVAFNTLSIQPSQTPLYIPQVIMPVGFALLIAALLHTSITTFLQAIGRLPIAPAAKPASTGSE